MKTFVMMKRSVFIVMAIVFGQADASVNFSSRESTLKLKDANAKLILETPITGYDGTLKIEGKTDDSVQGATGTDTITFSEGVVAAGANKFVLTGVYNPATSDTIELGDDDTLEVAAGSIAQSVTIAGTTGADSIIKGQPVFSSAVVINGATNFLKLGIHNKLTQNITLNGGTLTLTEDLSLQDGVFLDGTGTVDIGNFTLGIANSVGGAWSGTLTLKNAEDIQLNGYTILTGEWDFDDAAGSSHLNGNGNILDMSGGGTITVADNHTLYMSDVHLKGLGSGQGELDISATGGVIRMSNVTMELGADYAHDSGTIYIQGDNCRVISGDSAGGNHNFNVSVAGTKLTVDHAVLEYETLGGQNVSPFTFTIMGTQKDLINGGVIRSATLETSSGDLIFDEAESPVLMNNHDITASTNLVFTNIAGGAQTVTLDGAGYFLQFPDSVAGYFQIANDLTVTLENVVLKDFEPGVISYGTSAALEFGDGCVIELNKDMTIGAASEPWTFVGNATLEGYGHTIRLEGAADRLTADNDTKVVKIQNAKIQIDHASALSCLHYGSKFELQDVEICIEDSGYTFALGSIDVKNDVKIKGCDPVNPGGVSLFTYSTTGTLTVQKASSLELFGDVNFTYQASPTPTDGLTPFVEADFNASRRKLKLTDPSSTLHLNCCTLTSTDTGIALDYGNFVVEDKVVFNINTTAGAEAELGTALDVSIKAGATLEVGGPLRYVSSTFP